MSILSTFVKIFKNCYKCQNCQKLSTTFRIVKNCQNRQNCQKLSKLPKIVKNVKIVKNRQLSKMSKCSTIVKIVKNGHKLSKLTKLSKLSKIWPYDQIWPNGYRTICDKYGPDHMRQIWASGVSLETAIKMKLSSANYMVVACSYKIVWPKIDFCIFWPKIEMAGKLLFMGL